jgi:CheY-like chemotaxis protein/HPt (histidine-containing phosphotransfer) domain-containing protein
MKKEQNITDEKSQLPTVLFVDDDESSLFVFKAFLYGHCHIETADNGVSALEKMKTGQYKMIFMDIQMPQMDGLTTIEHFRAWEQSDTTQKRTPIIVITAKAFQKDRESSYCSGCDIFLTKPIEKKVLLENFKRYSGSEIEPVWYGSLHNKDSEKSVSDDMVLNQGYLDKLVKSLGREKFTTLVSIYSLSGEKMLSEIERLHTINEMESIIESAHRIKGMAKHLGLNRFAKLAEEIQERASNGEGEKIGELLEEIRPVFSESSHALNQF